MHVEVGAVLRAFGSASWNRAAVACVALLCVGLPAGASAARTSPQVTADAARLAGTTSYEAIVRFKRGGPAAQRAILARQGLRVKQTLRAIRAYVVSGELRDVAALARKRAVAYVERNEQLQWLGDTAPWASRVRVAQTAVSGGPYRDATGRVLDGSGIGVAIVDSGVEAGHPDLVNRVATNYKAAVPPSGRNLGPGSSTDTTSGHGTHVSGIVAGDGTASQGTYRGVAPGSTLHVFSGGETLSMAFAAIALDVLYTRFESLTPRVRVVNNSWGNPGGSAYDPNSSLSVLIRKLVNDKGVLMVFAAGNDGGDGTADKTSSYCKDPTPGIICVANYDDGDTGARDSTLDDSSGRAKRGEPLNYPDVAAPGTFVTSTCSPTALLCSAPGLITPSPAWAPWYGSASGTSMAAPHVAGLAALLLQAKPSLTPVDLEDIVLDTAHRFSFGGPYEADPQNAGGLTSFDKGAGLVDAVAALQDARVGAVGAGEASPTQLVSGDGGDYSGPGAADIESLDVAPGVGGVSYTITVRDAGAVAPGGVGLRVTQNVDGKARRTNVTVTASGVAARGAESPDDPATAEATSATLSGNAVTFFVPYSELGDPPAGAPAHNVFASSFIQAISDVAPSPSGTTVGADVIVRPRYAPPYTVR